MASSSSRTQGTGVIGMRSPLRSAANGQDGSVRSLVTRVVRRRGERDGRGRQVAGHGAPPGPGPPRRPSPPRRSARVLQRRSNAAHPLSGVALGDPPLVRVHRWPPDELSATLDHALRMLDAWGWLLTSTDDLVGVGLALTPAASLAPGLGRARASPSALAGATRP